MSQGNVGGAILCGGASSRMGQPKALTDLGDGTLAVQRLARAMRAAGLSPVVAVTGLLGPSAKDLAPHVDHVIQDAGTAGQTGPLLGMAAGLAALNSAVVFWPVDTPLVPPAVLALLAAGQGAWVMPGNPLAARVPQALLPQVTALLAGGQRGARALWRSVRPKTVRQGALWTWDPGGLARLSFNTPDELAQVAARGAKWVMLEGGFGTSHP